MSKKVKYRNLGGKKILLRAESGGRRAESEGRRAESGERRI